MNALIRQLLCAANPALPLEVGSFRRAHAQVPSTARGRTVAVIGREAGSGTSTVVAMMALTAAAYTANRVAVIETNPTGTGAGTGAGSGTGAGTGPGRGVTALLGGAGDGRLPALLAVPDGESVARRRILAASTPGTAVTVLALPAEAGSFAPQVLEQTLARLRHRCDLTLIDTPSDRGEPVFHAVLHLVDHVVLVLRADAQAPERLAAMRRWLAATPGLPRRHDVSVVLVARTRFPPSWRPEDLPWVLVRRDGALRRAGAANRRGPDQPLGRMSRASSRSALELLASVSAPLSRWNPPA